MYTVGLPSAAPSRKWIFLQVYNWIYFILCIYLFFSVLECVGHPPLLMSLISYFLEMSRFEPRPAVARRRDQLSHPFPSLATQLPYLATYIHTCIFRQVNLCFTVTVFYASLMFRYCNTQFITTKQGTMYNIFFFSRKLYGSNPSLKKKS